MSDVDTHMSQIMEHYWINFIKTGNPNATALPYWSVFKQDSPTVMYMKEGFFLAPVPNKIQVDFLEGYFDKLRKEYK